MPITPVHMPVPHAMQDLLPRLGWGYSMLPTILKEPPALENPEDNITPIHGLSHLQQQQHTVLPEHLADVGSRNRQTSCRVDCVTGNDHVLALQQIFRRLFLNVVCPELHERILLVPLPRRRDEAGCQIPEGIFDIDTQASQQRQQIVRCTSRASSHLYNLQRPFLRVARCR